MGSTTCTRSAATRAARTPTTSWSSCLRGTYKTESRKKIYLYLAVGYPNLPGRWTLDKGATASKVKKINSGEFEVRLSFYIRVHGFTRWLPTSCTKDTESKDGMGLPGHHGCGNKHISIKTKYIG